MILTKVNKEILLAKKSGQKERANSLVLLKSELLNNEKTEKPKEEIQVAISYAKKLEKALDLYEDEVKISELKKEISVIKEFLPKELTSEEIKEGVRYFLKSNPELNNMGLAMKSLKEKYPTQGKELSRYVKDFLSGKEDL